jgi:hypothetical protein
MMNQIPTIEAILLDPSTSFWLKGALESALNRDLVDAANDANVLNQVLQNRANQQTQYTAEVMCDEDYRQLTPQAKAAYDVIRSAGYIIHSRDVMEQVVHVVINNVLSRWSGFPISQGVKSAQEIMREQREEEQSIAIFKTFDKHKKQGSLNK